MCSVPSSLSDVFRAALNIKNLEEAALDAVSDIPLNASIASPRSPISRAQSMIFLRGR